MFGSKLPFLKNKKLPRVTSEVQDEKIYNGNSDDYLEKHLIEEMMDAHHEKDTKKFRQALEAVVHGMFVAEGADE